MMELTPDEARVLLKQLFLAPGMTKETMTLFLSGIDKLRAIVGGRDELPNEGPVLEPAVHILSEGLPLCNFSPSPFPRDWPEGHTWVGWSDGPARISATATCAPCLAIYDHGKRP